MPSSSQQSQRGSAPLDFVFVALGATIVCLVTLAIAVTGFAHAKEVDAVSEAARYARLADSDVQATSAAISARIAESFAGWPFRPRLVALGVADWNSSGIQLDARFDLFGGSGLFVSQEVRAHAASELN